MSIEIVLEYGTSNNKECCIKCENKNFLILRLSEKNLGLKMFKYDEKQKREKER